MRTTAALLCLMIATSAAANDSQPELEQTVARPDLILNQQESIVSTEFIVFRLPQPVGEQEEPPADDVLLVPPMTLIWNRAAMNPQVRHPFMLIKKENIKKNP